MGFLSVWNNPLAESAAVAAACIYEVTLNPKPLNRDTARAMPWSIDYGAVGIPLPSASEPRGTRRHQRIWSR